MHGVQKNQWLFFTLLILLIARPAWAQTNPTIGNVDGVFGDGTGAVILRGWVCWKGYVLSLAAPQVDVYVGGEAGSGGVKLGTYNVNQPSEAAVLDACKNHNTNSRFIIGITIATQQQYGGQRLYVYGSPFANRDPYTLLPGSGEYTVPVAPAVTDSVYYIHTDRLGSNVIMTDTSANVVAKTEYTAYGAAAPNTGKNEAPGYTGHYEDPLTGLTYMQARYYDADIGRFISIDPMAATPGDLSSFGRYTYANDNPLSFVDPNGQAAKNVTGVTVIGNVFGLPPFFGAPAYAMSGGGGSSGGSSGGGGGGIATVSTVHVTADRPPDDAPIVGGSPVPAYADAVRAQILDAFDIKFNGSFGLAATGQFMAVTGGVEFGIAVDSHLTPCVYFSGTKGLGLGLPIWGAAGAVGSLGTGLLSSGKQVSYGGYWAGGAGPFGEGQVTHAVGGGSSYARGIVGVSGSPEGIAGGFGGIKVMTTFKCL